MHNRGLCRRPVSVRTYVRLSVRHARVKTSKHNYLLQFHTKRYDDIPTGASYNWGKHRDFRPISGFAIESIQQ